MVESVDGGQDDVHGFVISLEERDEHSDRCVRGVEEQVVEEVPRLYLGVQQLPDLFQVNEDRQAVWLKYIW